MSYILGLDAGNSKTIALIADLKGNILSYGRSACGDISNRDIGSVQALKNVIAAVQIALTNANVDVNEIKARAFSMAGADWPEDFKFLKVELSKYPWGKDAYIVNDALGALRSASVEGFGVAVVCGTYAVTSARSPTGKSWHASFWQETGGAYKLAQDALRAIYRTSLGIDKTTSLTAAILTYLNKPTVEAVLHSLTARGTEVLESDIAKLAPLVLTEAEKGDEIARSILKTQATILAEYIFAAARKVDLEDAFKVFLTGGVFRHPSKLLEYELKARVLQIQPGVESISNQTEPILGALLYALEQTNLAITQQLYDQLKEALPDKSLFAT